MASQHQTDRTTLPADTEVITTICKLIHQADHVLIAAGAGLSAEAGIDYTDAHRFASMFPAFLKRGFKTNYDVIGYDGWTPAAKWAYHAINVQHDFFEVQEHPVYLQLLEILNKKDYFILTSNVDGLFYRNHFKANKIFTPQGNYSRLQCLTPCSQQTWGIENYLDALLANINSVTQEVEDTSTLPVCPQCGGEMTLNVRSGYWFVEKPYQHQEKLFNKWLQKSKGGNLLVIELGVGFNTPSVIRWPVEKIIADVAHARLIRVNMDYADVPEGTKERSISVKARIASFVEATSKQLKEKRKHHSIVE